MIHVRQLCKSYDDLQTGAFVALDRLSFDAMPGQVYGLLGPNGAGKTTALRILSTMLKPTSGTALIHGVDVVQDPEAVRRQIGFVSNNTSIYDRMTAWEIVDFFGRLNGLEPDELEARIETLFKRFRMESIRNLFGSKMSTGMKQKVSIARALVHDPPILVFDEATLGLDLVVAREVVRTIEELREQGKCIVYSSHIISEIERLCDRVGILVQGQLVAEGEIPDLKEQLGESDFEELFYQLLIADARKPQLADASGNALNATTEPA